MSHIDEREIALYLTGEVSEDRAAAVTAHLADCPACTQLLAEFQQTAQFFQSSREPELQDLIDVRQRVLARVAASRPHHRRWIWSLVPAAAVIIALIVFYIPKPRVRSVPPVQVAVELPSPQVPIPAMQIGTLKIHQPKPGLRSVALIARDKQPPLIKLTTADPNVVILLLPDERNQSRD